MRAIQVRSTSRVVASARLERNILPLGAVALAHVEVVRIEAAKDEVRVEDGADVGTDS